VRSKRFERLAERPIHRETFIKPWPEVGLVAIHSPLDPRPSLTIRDGMVVEMDGKRQEEFDLIDLFIARYALNLAVAPRAMQTPSREIARMIVDINVPRAEVLELVSGCTPAKLVDIVQEMSVLEMMMGLAKMRARRTPANQAHVTNRKEHPALLAADAAEAARPADPATLPPAWLAAMRRRAKAGRARVERHCGIMLPCSSRSQASRTARLERSRVPCRPRSGSRRPPPSVPRFRPMSGRTCATKRPSARRS